LVGAMPTWDEDKV